MSTYWGYRCTDCNHDSDKWLNHGDDVLAEFYHAWRLLSPVRDKLPSVGLFIDGGWPSGEMSEFMQAHGAHHVVLHNEYGVIKEIPPLGNSELSGN